MQSQILSPVCAKCGRGERKQTKKECSQSTPALPERTHLQHKKEDMESKKGKGQTSIGTTVMKRVRNQLPTRHSRSNPSFLRCFAIFRYRVSTSFCRVWMSTWSPDIVLE